MIPQSQISKLSNRLFKEHEDRRIPENVLERDYCIAWFLIGLARTSLKRKPCPCGYFYKFQIQR